MKVFVTGGAGFIGSHIADKLIADGNFVTVYDNFSTGFKFFIEKHLKNKNFQLVEGDLLDTEKLNKAIKGHDVVFHFAAFADVRSAIKDTKKLFDQNILTTYNILEAMRINGIKEIIFASTAVVYGEPNKFPTPEDYPLVQTSFYGATKVASEAMIQSYSEFYSMKNWIYRFTSWIGERYTHGVIFDFVKKLKENPKELEILGDGTQKKSYLYAEDGVNGVLLGWKKAKDKNNIFNLGYNDFMDVKTLADIICDEMKIKNVKYKFLGGPRGWLGDAPLVYLDTKKISKLGWKPKFTIEEGIRRTVRYMLANPQLLVRR